MDKKEFRKLISEKIIILDGATGTELQKRNFLDGIRAPEELNIKYPERIQAVYSDYFSSGSDAVLSNTFGANRLKLKDFGLENRLEEINIKGIALAKQAAKKYNGLVIGDIGPLGSYLTPLGPVSFDQAYEIFAEQAKAIAKAEPDIIVVETMAEIRELKSAVLAVKDNFDGPVIAQMTFTSDGTTVTGTGLLAFLSVMESIGADAIGLNCSVGPKELVKLAKTLAQYSTLPISFKPNAGMPKLINRETIFPGTAKEFVKNCEKAYFSGVNLIGGCCGTTPEFIKELAKKLKNKMPVQRNVKESFLLSSRTKAIDIRDFKEIVKIGERINPTGKKYFQDELFEGNFTTIRNEAKNQVKAGADILDINLGLPGADEKALMAKTIEEIQETVSVPLCLDSSSAAILEAGLKVCAGKPIINSVNGEKEKLDKIIPLAKRYGAGLIALTTNENGLPKTAKERISIAKKILEKTKEYGIKESEIIFDFLAIAVSASKDQAIETLEAIKEAKKLFPKASFSLGISNISFGLPNRQALNSTFLKLSKKAGLNIAILNPKENWNIDDPEARDLLLNKDPGVQKYIKKHSSFVKKTVEIKKENLLPDAKLFNYIIEGNREEISKITKAALALGKTPVQISNEIILKALNEVGEKFKNKEYFLPQVIRSAEAAQAAFSVIKPLIAKEGSKTQNKKIVVATVKGDFHDIGKNIVAAVLESFGWEIIDLGKNVESKIILETAVKENAKLIALSALMTTTMIEMEKVIKERNKKGLAVKIIVGGAPVTEGFAKEIGADGYAKDAVETAKLAENLIKN